MTVFELIEELSKLPGHKEAMIRVYDEEFGAWVDDRAAAIDRVSLVGVYVMLEPKE